MSFSFCIAAQETGKIPENTLLPLVFSLGIFPIEMKSFMFIMLMRLQQTFHGSSQTQLKYS